MTRVVREIDACVAATPHYFFMLAIAFMLRPPPPLAVTEDRTLLAVNGLVGCVVVLPLVLGGDVCLMSILWGNFQVRASTDITGVEADEERPVRCSDSATYAAFIEKRAC